MLPGKRVFFLKEQIHSMRANILTGTAFLRAMFFSSFFLINQAKAKILVTPLLAPPTAMPDIATTTEGKPVSVTVWTNDLAVSAMLDPQMVKLLDPVTGLRAFTVTIPNEGLFAVNFLTGVVTFSPVAGFVGVSTINYDIQDLNGEFSNQAAITVTVTTDPLPVTLSTFSIKKEGQIARLNWATTEETNSDYFEIQHSVSGKGWEAVGQVASSGESKVLKNYSFSHANPVHGQNLYRLKMVDRDMTFAYSRIQSVSFEGIAAADLSVYPNPSSDKLFIRDNGTVKDVVINNLNGNAVYRSSASFEAGNGLIDVTKLPQGMYIVKVTRKNGLVSTSKVVVNK